MASLNAISTDKGHLVSYDFNIDEWTDCHHSVEVETFFPLVSYGGVSPTFDDQENAL
jgi:hypothetical protein